MRARAFLTRQAEVSGSCIQSGRRERARFLREETSLPATKKRSMKKRGPVRPTKTVYLRLPHGMVNEIHAAAKARGWTMNRWVETLLEEVLPAKLAADRADKKS